MSIRAVAGIALCCALTGPARADGGSSGALSKVLSGRPIQDGIGIEVGAIVKSGLSELGDDHAQIAPSAQGIFIRDRNGLTSRMVIGLVIAVAGAMAASGPKSVESHSYRSGDYIVTETTTTYYSEEEKRQMNENTSKAVAGLFTARYSDFEIDLYSRDKFKHGDTSGYKANFFVGGGSSKVGYETGFGFGKADSLVDDETYGMTNIKWKYLGMPFRLTYLDGAVRASLTYEWNWLKYGEKDTMNRFLQTETDTMGMPTGRKYVTSVSHPWHLDVSTTLFKRIAFTGGVTLQEAKHPTRAGYYAQAGIFF